MCSLRNNTLVTLLEQNILRNRVVSWNCQNLEVAYHHLLKKKIRCHRMSRILIILYFLYESHWSSLREATHTRGKHANFTPGTRNPNGALQYYSSVAYYNAMDTTHSYTVIWLRNKELYNQTQFLACASFAAVQSSRFTLPLFLQVVWAARTFMVYFTRAGG